MWICTDLDVSGMPRWPNANCWWLTLVNFPNAAKCPSLKEVLSICLGFRFLLHCRQLTDCCSGHQSSNACSLDKDCSIQEINQSRKKHWKNQGSLWQLQGSGRFCGGFKAGFSSFCSTALIPEEIQILLQLFKFVCSQERFLQNRVLVLTLDSLLTKQESLIQPNLGKVLIHQGYF